MLRKFVVSPSKKRSEFSLLLSLPTRFKWFSQFFANSGIDFLHNAGFNKGWKIWFGEPGGRPQGSPLDSASKSAKMLKGVETTRLLLPQLLPHCHWWSGHFKVKLFNSKEFFLHDSLPRPPGICPDGLVRCHYLQTLRAMFWRCHTKLN
jgi:hypothetical protein